MWTWTVFNINLVYTINSHQHKSGHNYRVELRVLALLTYYVFLIIFLLLHFNSGGIWLQLNMNILIIYLFTIVFICLLNNVYFINSFASFNVEYLYLSLLLI